MSGLLLFLSHSDDSVGCSWEDLLKVFEILWWWQGAAELVDDRFLVDSGYACGMVFIGDL